MVKTVTTYGGELHCTIVHPSSGSEIETDAPKDNQGRGERFSPTDLLGAALSSCILTTMALVAERDNVPFVGAQAELEKHMTAPPRRVEALKVTVTLSKDLPEEYRSKLERVAHQCPVHKALHPDVQAPIVFKYV